MLLLYTGVRVSELCSIKIKDIDFLNYFIKVYGKGGKFRKVSLKQALVCVMRRLNNITYGMMKNKSEYVLPNVEIKEVA